MMLLMIFWSLAAHFSTGDRINGTWTDPKHEIEIKCYQKNGKYFGKIVWVKNVAHPNEPLPAHERHWIGMEVMKDFEYENGKWVNGTIYNIKTDKTYSAYITQPNSSTLQLTGYVLLPIFSQTQYFYKVNK